MIRKGFKWFAITVGGLISLLAVACIVVYVLTATELNKKYEIKIDPIPIPSYPDSLTQGKYLASTIAGCTDCHGPDLSGRIMNDDLIFGRLVATNLTGGRGGIGKEFNDEDWIRAVRHGVGQKGRALTVMPSFYFHNLSERDLGTIIGYIKSVPPVDKTLPDNRWGPVARILYLTGNFPGLLPAKQIDHDSAISKSPERGSNSAYGKYLVEIGGCRDCHKTDLKGGPILAAPPGTPPGIDLTRNGPLKSWSRDDFIKTMRTGTDPSGKALNSYMPWKYLGKLTDDDLTALYLYLKSVN